MQWFNTILNRRGGRQLAELRRQQEVASLNSCKNSGGVLRHRSVKAYCVKVSAFVFTTEISNRLSPLDFETAAVYNNFMKGYVLTNEVLAST